MVLVKAEPKDEQLDPRRATCSEKPMGTRLDAPKASMMDCCWVRSEHQYYWWVLETPSETGRDGLMVSARDSVFR